MDAAYIRQPEGWSRVLGWSTLTGVELGLIGPFGSYAANPFTRMAYWIGLCWLGTLILWPSIVMSIARGRTLRIPPLFAGAIVVLAGCVPLAILAAEACRLFWPVRASSIRALEWYGSTLLVAAPCVALLLRLEWTRVASSVPEISLAPARLPDDRRAGLPPTQLALALCLQMEDHHVRLHLPSGSRLHLASLRDAIAQADPSRGMQVHRSWWVARDAVAHGEAKGRSFSLVLTNGMRVPVARNRISEVRRAGWLD